LAIRYDPALVSGLGREIRSRWIGRRVAGLRLNRESREAWIVFGEGPIEEKVIGFLLHPSRGFIVSGGAFRSGLAGSERRIDFRRLFLTAVWSPDDERLLVLELAGGRSQAQLSHAQPDRPPVYRLYVELHTNQWNAVLARGDDDRVEAVLWSRAAGGRSLQPGAIYGRPEGARAWATDPPAEAEWTRLLDTVPSGQRRDVLLRSAAWTSSLNVDWILGDAARDDAPAGDGPADPVAGTYGRYSRIRAAVTGEAWLLTRGTVAQPYPVRLDADARRFGSLMAAMRVAAAESSTWPATDAADTDVQTGPGATPDAERLERSLRRRIGDLKKRRAALQRQLEGESADSLRDIGHLLLTRQREVPKGTESVSLEGFDGSEMEVRLDPRLDAIQNAERFYERARRRERGARALPGRLKRTTDRVLRLEAAVETLRTSGPSDELWDLVGGDPEQRRIARGARRGADDEPLPYRRYRSSGGLEIRVGRSARANDALTFQHSSPDDVWLPAQQAGGAHVILRWDRRDQNPPPADLAEAAVLAALRSEARHSGVVAVDWTRRKYVRKPRKAAPGVVAPERVSTLFVEPDPAVESRLSTDD
jgi:predicted ribosome quality control (RQC) complex YloA/Tae2 family protein